MEDKSEVRITLVPKILNSGNLVEKEDIPQIIIPPRTRSPSQILSASSSSESAQGQNKLRDNHIANPDDDVGKINESDSDYTKVNII